jgi:hypothetical protein
VSLPNSCLQTAATRAFVVKAVQGGMVYSCTNRFLFQVATLKAVVRGPFSFKLGVRVDGCCAKLSMAIGDLGMNEQARCVAVAGRGGFGPEDGLSVVPKDVLREMAAGLRVQVGARVRARAHTRARTHTRTHTHAHAHVTTSLRGAGACCRRTRVRSVRGQRRGWPPQPRLPQRTASRTLSRRHPQRRPHACC